MIHPKYMANNGVKYYLDPAWQSEVVLDNIFDCVDFDLGDMTFGQGHDTPLGNGTFLQI